MDPVVPFDWSRMLIGDEQPLFLLEIVLRIAIIWPWTMLLLRWIGGRSISQLSLVEFLLVIGLGSAVGDAFFYPEVPLLHAMLVILVVVIIDKLIDLAIRRIEGAKRIVDGQPVEVLRDGVLRAPITGTRPIGNLELMELLRLKGVQNLGSVGRAYIEPSGKISVFPMHPPRNGLPIVPPVEEFDFVDRPDPPRCCSNCGLLDETAEACPNCGVTRWTTAAAAPEMR